MHARRSALLAFCDGEAGTDRSRRIASHLARCEKCRDRLRLIQSEKDELSAGDAKPAMGSKRALAGVLTAMATWQGTKTTVAKSELTRRLRWQIETYFGSPAVSVVEGHGIRVEELLGKTSEMLDVFLGPSAAEAVKDDVLRGLSCARLGVETWR